MFLRITVGAVNLLRLVGVLGCLAGGSAAAADKPRLTLHVYEEEDAVAGAPSKSDAIDGALAELMDHDERVKWFKFYDLLEPPDVAARALGEADLALHDAEQSFAEMDLDKTKELLKNAILTYQQYLPQLAARGGGITPLRDAWIKLAKTRFFDGDQPGSRDALRYVFAVDPGMKTFDPKLFPPQMKKTVVEARLLFDTLGSGKLTVDSDPQGAIVYLNGIKLEKVTPTDAVDAQPGPNFISYRRRGYAPLTAIFEHNGGGDSATATQSLSRYPNNPLQPLDRARAQLDKTDTPPLLKDACDKLKVDMLMLVRTKATARPDGEAATLVSVYLYDARPDRVIKKVEKTVIEKDTVEAARALSQQVMDGVRFDGIWAPPPKPVKKSGWVMFKEKAKADLTKFYEWPGFWYVVGGVGGAIVLSVAIGVGVSEHQRQLANESVILIGGN
jgi:hypothetical protein